MRKAIITILIATVTLTIATAFIPVNHIERSGGGCFKGGCVQANNVGYSGNGVPFTYNIKCENYYCEGNGGLTSIYYQSKDMIKLVIIPLVLNFLVYLLAASVGYLIWHYTKKLRARKHLRAFR